MRTAAACLLTLALMSPAAVATSDATCATQRKSPVEVETLHVTIPRIDGAQRAGTQVTVRARVTRLVRPGSPVSPYTEQVPIALAFVYTTFTAGSRVLDETGNETDADGWASVRFNIPPTAPPGPVAVSAYARYTLVGSLECEEPYVVETGHGDEDAVVTVRA